MITITEQRIDMHWCQNSAVGNDDSVVVGHQKINGGQ